MKNITTRQPNKKQNTNYDRSRKLFSTALLVLVVRLLFQLRVSRAKISHGTNSHFILHMKNMC